MRELRRHVQGPRAVGLDLVHGSSVVLRPRLRGCLGYRTHSDSVGIDQALDVGRIGVRDPHVHPVAQKWPRGLAGALADACGDRRLTGCRGCR